MSLKLYYHPLSSFCWKALIALYENDTPHEKVLVDLGEEKSRADFLKVWPIGKFPVVEDTVRDWRSSFMREGLVHARRLGRHRATPRMVNSYPSDREIASP